MESTRSVGNRRSWIQRVLVGAVLSAAILVWVALSRHSPPRSAGSNIVETVPVTNSATVTAAAPSTTLLIGPANENTSVSTKPSVLAKRLATFANALPPDACLVVQEGNSLSVAVNPDKALIPASTLKLFTAIAAINALGSDHHFTTSVLAAAPATNGRLVGDLVLVGDGDPVLSTARYQSNQRHQPAIATSLEVLADRITQAGITTVTGSIVGDEHKFAPDRFLPSWGYPYDYATRTGPLSALELNDGWASPTDVQTDPAQYAASILQQILVTRGVTFGVDARSGTLSSQRTVIAQIESPPVHVIVEEMLRNSDNMTAELLAKNIDSARHGPGTILTAAATIQTALAEEGFSFKALQMIDASGTAASNQASCTNLIQAVNSLRAKSSLAQRGFATAGLTGTLSSRYINTPAQGRLHAKTGSITGVASMTGYIDPEPLTTNPTITFAIIINNVISNKKYAYEDTLIDLLTQ